jgi:hypothetical protein
VRIDVRCAHVAGQSGWTCPINGPEEKSKTEKMLHTLISALSHDRFRGSIFGNALRALMPKVDRLLPWRAVVWAKAAQDDGIAVVARIRPQSHVFANANQLASAQAPIAPSANDFLLMKFSRPFGSFVDVWSWLFFEFLFIRPISLIRG